MEEGTILQPLVSILIPAYNAERWIADTLRSALAQTWKTREIVVVNDGSTDRTLTILRQFEADGVRVITQRNQGAAAARNRAFAGSRGDYIQWLDADDLLEPDKIARQVAVLEQHRGDRRILLSGAWGKFLYRTHRTRFVPSGLWSNLSPCEWMTRRMEQDVYMQTATWLVSRELTEVAGPWDTRLLVDDDGEYFCRVLKASAGIRFIPEAKVYYRSTGPASLSYIGLSERRMEAQWLSMKLHIAHLRELDDGPRVRAACINYLQNGLIVFYPERLDLVEQAEAAANELGGRLGLPCLSWKYSWIAAAFGWRSAKRAQRVLPKVRWALLRSLDRALLRMEVWNCAHAHSVAPR